MVTSVKTAVKAAAKSTTKTAPSLRFYHSKALGEKTNKVLSALEKQPSHAEHGEAIADLVNELIEAGMDYYFLKALKAADVGFVTEQSARLGMSGAVKLISSVSRKFITRMDQDQLLVVAVHIRSLSAT
jgi:ethanolamine utilization microcompartment shell protein EutL